MAATDPANSVVHLSQLYNERFNEKDRLLKERIWQILCHDFFQRYVQLSDTVLDIGAGYCEFINNINCAHKIALDLNEDTPKFAAPNVRIVQCMSNAMHEISDQSVDVAFASNFFEHMPTKEIFLQKL